MSADRRGSAIQRNSGQEVYLGGIDVGAAEAIGQFNMVGTRSTDGVLEDYDPAAVSAAYTYLMVGVATASITGGVADGDVVTDKNVVYGGIFLFDTNADCTELDVGKLVYGETSLKVKVASVVDGIVVGRLIQYNGDNTGYVLVAQHA